MVGNGDDRVNFAIERLMEPGEGWRALVREMVARWPDVAPLEIAFSLVAAAAAIEANFSAESPAREGAEIGYRLAALVSVDFYAMQLLGLARTRAGDFLAYWEQDPFFARL